MVACGAEARRRDDRIRCVQTLDELTEELKNRGFNISRSGVYLHLLPHNPKSQEGRRHVNTVPVRLIRAENSTHKSHVDGKFATASIRYLESLASLLGPKEVTFLSMDDKARVPIGLTTASKQAPLLMSMEYRVSLPDHDLVLAEKHKLIPSVIAGITIKEDGLGHPNAVGYSGPTHVSIRSAKHSSSTAASHSDDRRRVLELSNFKSIVKTPNGQVKPVMIITVDGGPDECPRYKKNVAFAITNFKDLNLDALFLACNAPGRSVFNRVERRMAPLSHRMAGVVLPHDSFGTHLDSQGRTINAVLEKKKFEAAGSVLVNLYSTMEIDGFPVSADFISAQASELPDAISAEWKNAHVRESQYLLQIIKCQSNECCGPLRSALGSVLGRGFLPPPMRVQQTSSGLSALEPDDVSGHFLPLFPRLAMTLQPPAKGFKRTPYDLYCPSVYSQLSGRVCKTCGVYFASKQSLTVHMRALHPSKSKEPTCVRIRPASVLLRREREVLCRLRNDSSSEAEDVEWLDVDDIEEPEAQTVEEPDSSEVALPIIKSLAEWLATP